MALPLKTTTDDVRDIVRYLKTKPTGATLNEAKAAVPRKLLDTRKLAAYATWGIITREDGRLKLTDRGWKLSKGDSDERAAFMEIIDAVRPYRSILEWAHHNQVSPITAIDAARHLHEHHQAVVGDANDNTLRENSVTFFHVADAAGLGTLTLGRAGQPTRLEVNASALKRHIEAGPQTPPWTEADDTDEEPETPEEDGGGEADALEPEPITNGASTNGGGDGAPAPRLKVFISHGKNKDIVDQVEVMLGLAEIDAEIAEAEETTAIPVPDKVMNAMRRCDAGIIAVTVEEGRKDEKGEYVLNENVLIEIGAAFVLYERKVVLVWDKRLKVPSNLQGLYRCEFEGDELTWSAGMKLMKAIQGFKQPATSTPA
jgi:hypothetical protein